MTPVPRLAANAEPNRDGTRWRIALRDASWHDGTPLTADDVLFTLKAGFSVHRAAQARLSPPRRSARSISGHPGPSIPAPPKLRCRLHHSICPRCSPPMERAS
ncbi:MAG: ABC transporter substrate-binding protein [Mycobacterium sp.]|nr:ABC transporter substrate-binding protein [Mycobacterium sp.]